MSDDTLRETLFEGLTEYSGRRKWHGRELVDGLLVHLTEHGYSVVPTVLIEQLNAVPDEGRKMSGAGGDEFAHSYSVNQGRNISGDELKRYELLAQGHLRRDDQGYWITPGGDPYATTKKRWETPRRLNLTSEPPDDGICRLCYEWRPYPGSQSHFGYAWWKICRWSGRGCEHGCDNGHHAEEIWIG